MADFVDLPGFITAGLGGAWLTQFVVMVLVAALIAVKGRLRIGALVGSIIAMPVVAFAMAVLGIGSYWLATMSTLVLALSATAWTLLLRGR